MNNTLLPKVQESLQAHGITYKVFDCDPLLADTAAFCEKYDFRLDQSANSIIVIGKSHPVRYACCVVLATTKLDVNKKVRELLGIKKVSFAGMDDALEVTHMEYGGVTAFGLPVNVPVYVDARVMDCDEIIMGGGNRSSKLLLDPKELTKLSAVEVVQDLAKLKDTHI